MRDGPKMQILLLNRGVLISSMRRDTKFGKYLVLLIGSFVELDSANASASLFKGLQHGDAF